MIVALDFRSGVVRSELGALLLTLTISAACTKQSTHELPPAPGTSRSAEPSSEQKVTLREFFKKYSPDKVLGRASSSLDYGEFDGMRVPFPSTWIAERTQDRRLMAKDPRGTGAVVVFWHPAAVKPDQPGVADAVWAAGGVEIEETAAVHVHGHAGHTYRSRLGYVTLWHCPEARRLVHFATLVSEHSVALSALHKRMLQDFECHTKPLKSQPTADDSGGLSQAATDAR